MYRKIVSILILIVAFASAIFSQSSISNKNVTVKIDNRVDTLIAVQRIVNKESSHFSGYRIQIYSDAGNNSKSKAMEVQSVFARTNPDANTYLTFVEPYYKVRVGDFKTRIEAEKLLAQISGIYPAAFIVADKIVFDPQKNHQNDEN